MKKVIGVALTLISTELSREFLESLHKAAKIFDFRIIVFNSPVDFLTKDDTGAKYVYTLIPFERLDALVILHDTIYDSSVIDSLIEEGKKYGVPVIFARKEDERVYSVSGKSRIPYERLIRHVMEEHHVRDTFFISGKRNYDLDSLERIESYRKVLSEFGIPFNEEMVECGEYWEGPVLGIIDRLYQKRKGFPEAIFCANDIMAVAAIECVRKYGFKVPEDVIVTGFDGMECARCSTPSLSTVHENMEELGELIMQMICDIHNAGLPVSHYYYNYDTIISQSCGCERCRELFMRPSMDSLFKMNRLNGTDETRSNEWMDAIIEKNTFAYYRESVSDYLGENQLLFLRTDEDALLSIDEGRELISLSDSFDIYGGNIPENERSGHQKEDLFSCIDKFLDTDTMCIVSTICSKNLVAGIHVERTSNIKKDGGIIDRHERNLSRGLTSVLLYEHQLRLKEHLEENKFRDSLAEVLNNRGINRWFENFNAQSENHEKYLAVCIFHFINGEKIQEEHGNAAFENCIRFIGKNLKMSHPENAVMARISDLGFAVVLFAKNEKHRGELIYRCVEPFYSYIELHNKRNPKGPQIEVSSGSVDLDPGWKDSLNSYINSAYNELYKNRMAQYEGKSEEISNMDLNAERRALNTFTTLFRNNMLTYVFQPVVDARTGDIVGYEALLRTTGTVSMTPGEIMRIAKRHRRFSIVEEFTINRTLEVYSQKKDFKDKLLFVNTIVGHFLPQTELEALNEKYNDILSHIVLEINDADTMGFNEVNRLRKFGGKEEKVIIAVDGFGAGNANIMSLMNYHPSIVKIDRFLMNRLDTDVNKQMFVSNVVDFARKNNIRVLGLGVETREELQTAIRLGVDMVQGFYMARPSDQIPQAINSGVRNDILEAQKLRKEQ